MPLLSPLLLLVGLFLPGSLIARRMGHPLWWASGFVFSLLILFHSIFWLELFHAPIALRTVLPCLIVASTAAAWWARRHLRPAQANGGAKWDGTDRMLLLGSIVVGAALVLRTVTAPHLGLDTSFRWDFLAQRMLATETFRFYPPLTPADFKTYFYVDGIPPLVSFSNWWIYASAGKYQPTLVSVFAAAQFACTLAFVYGAAAALFSRRAGILAAAALAACPLYFNAVAIEQETGLTALGIAATLYFLIRARQPNDTPAMIAAGLSAALCALSREYGWIAVVVGVATLLWRKLPRRQAVIFAAAAAAAAGPWYVRNWIVAGNPLYSLSVGPFAVNPIHEGIMQYYRTVLAPGLWTPDTLGALLWFLLTLAPLQLAAGIPGAATRFRERGYLAAAAALLTLVWLQSVAYTSGGLGISTRVLSPALAVLSICAAGMLERWRGAAMVAILACQLWTVAQGSVYPGSFDVWPEQAFKPLLKPSEFQIRDQLAAALPPGTRILTDNAYLHAALADKGIDVVPVWSPEVGFLYTATAEEADQRLRSLAIETVAYYPQSLNTRYLTAKSPFYAQLPRRWRAVAESAGFLTFYQP
jgi:hypothetical protein